MVQNPKYKSEGHSFDSCLEHSDFFFLEYACHLLSSLHFVFLLLFFVYPVVICDLSVTEENEYDKLSGIFPAFKKMYFATKTHEI